MLLKPRSLTKLLIISLSINLVGLLFGGFCIYKARNYLLSWFNRVTSRTIYKVTPLGFYGLKVNEFETLSHQTRHRKVIIFAGDSLVDGLEWHEHFPISNSGIILKRSISGETLDRFIDRFEVTFLPEYDILKVFIMIGINDIRDSTFRIETFTQKYHALLEKFLAFLPADRICLHSLFPTRLENISNLQIKQVNSYLTAYAIGKRLCYIDLYDQLTDSTGHLNVNYTYDGIHLSFEGYKIWLRALTPYVLNVMRGDGPDSLASQHP